MMHDARVVPELTPGPELPEHLRSRKNPDGKKVLTEPVSPQPEQ